MERERTLSASVDYFLLVKGDQSPDRLVYYDKYGNCYERPVDPALVAEAFKIFDGKSRSVLRTSGGLSCAQPTQIVIPDPSQLNAQTQLRIRVQFRDLKNTANGVEYINHTKVVSPQELMPAFEYALHLPQRFVLETAQGLVPVYLYHVGINPKDPGKCLAYFVDCQEWEKVTQSQPGKSVSLQPYAIDRDVIRWATGTDSSRGRSVYDQAHIRLQQLKKNSQEAFPKALRVGFPLELPTGERPEDLRQFLRSTTVSDWAKDPIRIDIRKTEGEDLIPFGLFE